MRGPKKEGNPVGKERPPTQQQEEKRKREGGEVSGPRLSSTQLELWDCGAGVLLFYTQTFL